MTGIPSDYTAPPDSLRGRNILVSGAGGGIGAAAARACAAHGATVILLGRAPDKLHRVHDEIAALGHPRPIVHPLDLRDAGADGYRLLGESLGAELGCLHGLLNNASLLGERAPIATASAERWREVLEVNVTAQMLLTQALLPALGAAPRASVVFTSSGVGRVGRAYWGAYAVSKFATEGLMQVLADELENTSRIRVNSLNPGPVRTAMRAAAFPAEDPASLPAPEDIMPAYLYLMGDDSAHLNGAALSVP